MLYGCEKVPLPPYKDIVKAREIYMGPRIIKNKV